ncbi:MAG: hypothetical protein WC551_13255 [Patescibacteria group bacterium]
MTDAFYDDNFSLSKRDFEELGCEDVPGDRLRGRVWRLECTLAEVALALESLLQNLSASRIDSVVLESAYDAMGSAEVVIQRKKT